MNGYLLTENKKILPKEVVCVYVHFYIFMTKNGKISKFEIKNLNLKKYCKLDFQR